MERALELAQAEGADAFVFTNHSNGPAVALYEKVGGQAVNGDDLLFKYSYER
jgi:ribosomal protein S18 acetylase RimI-like enzyme